MWLNALAKTTGTAASRTRPNFNYTPAQQYIYFDSANDGRFRIFPKGRRLGATHGAACFVIEMMCEGKHVLWGDTIHANIIRYIDRYFLPILKQLGVPYEWRRAEAAIHIGPGYCDFRSATRPDTWEGFGYDVVFLNEAGIILDDPYLWHNAVLPMMLDNPDSTLIAAGTPKLSSMTGLLFKELWDKVLAGEPGYAGKRYSTYDNPHLSEAAIKQLEEEISPAERPQEIHGEFISPDDIGSYFRRDWFEQLPEAPHVVRTVRGWDFAATEPSTHTPDPDWTVGVKLGVTEAARLVILNVVMARTGPGGVDALLKRTAEEDGPETLQAVPVDPGAAGKTAFEHFREGPLSGYPVAEYPQRPNQGSKAVRATPVSIKAAEGADGEGIAYVKGVWNDWFFGQLTPFPNKNVHDDAVDALAAAYNEVSQSTVQLF